MSQAQTATFLPASLGFIDRAIAVFENRRALVVAGFSAFFLLVCALVSATKLMWYDEMTTYYPARLPVRGILSFFGQALDVHTPTASLVLHATMKALGDSPVTDRLPFMLGFLVMLLAIYRFVARRAPVEYAIAAMIFPAVSGVFYYATEIRCYGLELGLTGIALLCWQDAGFENAGGRRRAIAIPGLFLSLAGAMCCHYFAVFLLIPFALGELVRTWRRKRVDAPVWLALILSPSVLLLFVPAIRDARGIYTPDGLASAGLGHISNAYLTMLTPAFVPIFVAAVFYFLLAPKFSRRAPALVRPPIEERVLATTLALTPVIGALSAYVLGAYVYRYTLYAIAGISIFLAFEMCRGLKGDRMAAVVLSIALAGWFAAKSATTVHAAMVENGGIRTPLAEPYRNSAWMKALEGSSLPVMATPAVFFLQLQEYAPAEVRPRVLYAGDHALALKIEHSDTGETNLFSFRTMLPLRVEEFNDFVRANPHFLLAAETTYATGWHIPALIERGAQLRLLNRTDTYFVFDVTMEK